MQTVQCPACGHENKSTSKFCTECGCSFRVIKGFDGKEIALGIDNSSVQKNSDIKQISGNKKEKHQVGSPPPRWPFFVLGAAIIGLILILIVNLAPLHEYAPATCTKPKICIKCGKAEGKPLGHNWIITTCDKPRTCSRCGEVSSITSAHDWHISGDQIRCDNCSAVLTTADDIKAKNGTGLTGADRALIYDWVDYYLTAQNSNGQYTYSESEAFRKVQEKFGVSRDYINNNVWNYHAYDDYALYR